MEKIENNDFNNSLEIQLFTKEIDNIIEQLKFIDDKSYGSLKYSSYEGNIDIKEIIKNKEGEKKGWYSYGNNNKFDKMEFYYINKMCRRHPRTLSSLFGNIKSILSRINRYFIENKEQKNCSNKIVVELQYIKNILNKIRKDNNNQQFLSEKSYLNIENFKEQKNNNGDYDMLRTKNFYYFEEEEKNNQNNNNTHKNIIEEKREENIINLLKYLYDISEFFEFGAFEKK